MRRALSESWRRVDAETQPEGVDQLLWELGQPRKVAQDALARAARTHNLSATGHFELFDHPRSQAAFVPQFAEWLAPDCVEATSPSSCSAKPCGVRGSR